MILAQIVLGDIGIPGPKSTIIIQRYNNMRYYILLKNELKKKKKTIATIITPFHNFIIIFIVFA